MKRAFIVTGGSVLATFGSNYLSGYSFDLKIAVDSGIHFFYETGIRPDQIVGDFDSADKNELRFFESQEGIHIVRLIPEKDETDTQAALRLAISAGCTQIHLLGATGTRADHMLGNVGMLGMGLLEGVEILLADPYNRIRMIRDDLVISKEEQYGSFVSLLAVTPQVTGVTLKGMKYPLEDDVLFCFSSLAISNEIVSDTAEIHIKEGILLVVEAADTERKR